MYENFHRIPIQEQERILAICMEEFAQRGYQQASTNAMVARLGIPKGTLFYYFGSKRHLFLYILDRVIARFTAWIKSRAIDPPAELFERLLANHRVKMEFVIKEPLAYQFLYTAFVNMPAELKEDLASRIPQYTALSSQNLQTGLDLGRFKEGVDVPRAIQLIYLVLEGIFNRNQRRFAQLDATGSLKLLDDLTVEVMDYFELLKGGLYR